MRFHTDTLTRDDVIRAARKAGATIETLSSHGSRSRDHAFEVKLTGNSNRRPNGGSYGAGDDYAATWDQWGVFIGQLFNLDPDMTTIYYHDAGAFDAVTLGRFDILPDEPVPFSLSHDHSWAVASPGIQECRKCGAQHNYGARW